MRSRRIMQHKIVAIRSIACSVLRNVFSDADSTYRRPRVYVLGLLQPLDTFARDPATPRSGPHEAAALRARCPTAYGTADHTSKLWAQIVLQS